MNERKKNTKTNVNKDYYFPVILSQIFCCISIVLLFFFIRGGDGWQQVKEKYSVLLQEDFLTREFASAVSGMKEYLLEGGSSFAVFGSRVEPYDEPSAKEERSEPLTEEFYEAETEEASEPSTVKVESIALAEEKKNSVPLKLSYKREQKMVFPLDDGVYTSYFGERTDPIAEGYDFHKGIDIGADEGAGIKAVLDGNVISVGEDNRSGKYIFLEHENGRVTFYCHCSDIIAEEGEEIRQGEIIALVGSTGYSTGPHLHFEVRVNGVSLDPLPFIENAA